MSVKKKARSSQDPIEDGQAAYDSVEEEYNTILSELNRDASCQVKLYLLGDSRCDFCADAREVLKPLIASGAITEVDLTSSEAYPLVKYQQDTYGTIEVPIIFGMDCRGNIIEVEGGI